MWTTPEKVRETLGNANQNKTTRAEHKVSEKRRRRKLSDLKEPYEMLNKNTNNNSQIEEGQRKNPKMNQSNRKGTLQKPLSEEQTPTKC